MSEPKKDEVKQSLNELLQELRVALPGVQMLFGFLLTVPMMQRFERFTRGERAIYFVIFAATTIASLFLIGPSAYHRIAHHQHDKREVLHTANRLAIAGLACLAVSIAGSTLLITELMFGMRVALAIFAATSAFCGWLWFAMPVFRARRSRAATQERPSHARLSTG